MKLLVRLLPFLLCAAPATAAPLTMPFDFSHQAIGLDVAIRGTALHMMLDTGVDPSAIDSARAASLHLPVDKAGGGEASGVGDSAHAMIYPATIEGLAIAGRDFPAIDAVSMDMSGLSARYGRTLDGVLGYSLLNGRVWLIDYPRRTVSLLDAPGEAWSSVKTCRKRLTMPLKALGDDNIPVVEDFRFGPVTGSITLDTGSNRGIALTEAALDNPALNAALAEKGEAVSTGARGETRYKTYVLKARTGFGPFDLPAGEIVTVRGEGVGHAMANVGNEVFDKMKLKMLLDYKARLMTFYSGCLN